MNTNLILDTEGSKHWYITFLYILGVLECISGLLLWIFAMVYFTDIIDSADRLTYFLFISLVTLALFIPSGCYKIRQAGNYSGTYIKVFSDHMEGYAYVKRNGKEMFFLTFNRINHVTIKNQAILTIRADGKEYIILTKEPYANEVFRLFNSIQQSYRQQNIQFSNR